MPKRSSHILPVPFAIRHLACLLFFLLSLLSPVCAVEPVDQWIPDSLFLQKIPKRPRDAITGTQFARETTGMTGRDRQSRALDELLRGNVPDFLRKLKPVHLTYRSPQWEMITALIWVTPDYLAIGSDEDFLRIPLSYPSAIVVAQAFDCVLPTPKMVDAIYEQAAYCLEPDPLPPGPKMRSSEYYVKHREKIRAKRKEAGCALGELVAGHKKDIVLTNRLNEKPGRIAIYGWHRKTGEPIQPLSTVHGARYADYSHGLRLIYKTVWINGESRSILDVLQDPDLAPVLTHEGLISRLRVMLRLR
ncbi:MAG: hypothetical protein MIO92_01835 [Methanosarcinaceae archaeon]|nr:hypothetical protein [Methanosarcinaceae archaeon]